jgi:hypothetical protein
VSLCCRAVALIALVARLCVYVRRRAPRVCIMSHVVAGASLVARSMNVNAPAPPRWVYPYRLHLRPAGRDRSGGNRLVVPVGSPGTVVERVLAAQLWTRGIVAPGAKLTPAPRGGDPDVRYFPTGSTSSNDDNYAPWDGRSERESAVWYGTGPSVPGRVPTQVAVKLLRSDSWELEVLEALSEGPKVCPRVCARRRRGARARVCVCALCTLVLRSY